MKLLIFALRWLTDTLPPSQQTETYRKRRAAMIEFVTLLDNNGFRNSSR